MSKTSFVTTSRTFSFFPALHLIRLETCTQIACSVETKSQTKPSQLGIWLIYTKSTQCFVQHLYTNCWTSSFFVCMCVWSQTTLVFPRSETDNKKWTLRSGAWCSTQRPRADVRNMEVNLQVSVHVWTVLSFKSYSCKISKQITWWQCTLMLYGNTCFSRYKQVSFRFSWHKPL